MSCLHRCVLLGTQLSRVGKEGQVVLDGDSAKVLYLTQVRDPLLSESVNRQIIPLFSPCLLFGLRPKLVSALSSQLPRPDFGGASYRSRATASCAHQVRLLVILFFLTWPHGASFGDILGPNSPPLELFPVVGLVATTYGSSCPCTPARVICCHLQQSQDCVFSKATETLASVLARMCGQCRHCRGEECIASCQPRCCSLETVGSLDLTTTIRMAVGLPRRVRRGARRSLLPEAMDRQGPVVASHAAF